MSDSYQAVYDAVCSRIGRPDISGAVERALREANLSHYAEMAARTAQEAASEHMRPCVLYRPRVFIDGNKWIALYGENIQDGVAGSGDSPVEAMYDFDKHWHAKLSAGKS